MRVLLDNCVPWRLGRALTGYETSSVAKLGWADLDDGPLLDAMGDAFDVLITMDKSLRFQQRLAGRPFGIVLLWSRSNRIVDLLPLVPELLHVLGEIEPGQVKDVGRI